MEYVTAYFWQPQRNACSLLLQQIEERNGQQIVFACICEGSVKEAGDFTDYLRNWFYREVLSGRRMPQKRLQAISEKLFAVISKTEKSLKQTEFPICGIICVDRFFCMFSRCGVIQMFNTCFGRAHTDRILSAGNDIEIRLGELESGVGILLGSSGLWKITDRQRLAECLMVQEISESDRADKHLGEMCTQAVTEGATDIAAVLVISK